MKATTICTALIASAFAIGLSGCDSRDDSRTTGTSQTTPNQDNSATPNRGTSTNSADNTGRNRGDADRDTRTPMNQSQSNEHIQLTADIRRAVMAEDNLSSNAKNCKIITDSTGRVWLRGVVESQAEKDRIEQIARRIAVGATVTNELEVDYD